MFLAPRGATSGRAAFTLLELLVVISLVAVLAAIVLGAGRRAAEAGKVARAKAELAALASALEHYRGIFGDYPQTDDAAQLVQSLIGRRGPGNTVVAVHAFVETARFKTADTRDPYADTSAVLADPWAQPYRYTYKVPAAGWANSYVLYSIGPDGRDSAALLMGGFPDVTAIGNADNLYADQ